MMSIGAKTGLSRTSTGHPRWAPSSRDCSPQQLIPNQYPELTVASYNKNNAALNEPDGIVAVWNMHLVDRPEFVFHSQVRKHQYWGTQIHIDEICSRMSCQFHVHRSTRTLCLEVPTLDKSCYGTRDRNTSPCLRHRYLPPVTRTPSMRCKWPARKTRTTSSRAARMVWSAVGWSTCWHNLK